MLGLAYVINTKAAVLDDKALVVVTEFGPLGELWCLSGPSFADGLIHRRSAHERSTTRLIRLFLWCDSPVRL